MYIHIAHIPEIMRSSFVNSLFFFKFSRFFFNSLERKRLQQGEKGIFNIVFSIKYAALVSSLGDAM